MADKSRINGWLRHQLVYKVVESNPGHWYTAPRTYHVLFSLVIVPGVNGSRVAVYKNGERLGRSIRLGGANAVEASAEDIVRELNIVTHSTREMRPLADVVKEGETWRTNTYRGGITGTVTLIAKI